MIIYTQRCLVCSNRQLWKKIKAFAAKHNLQIEERRVGLKYEWMKDAESYDIPLPFVVYEGKALSLTEDLEELLK